LQEVLLAGCASDDQRISDIVEISSCSPWGQLLHFDSGELGQQLVVQTLVTGLKAIFAGQPTPHTHVNFPGSELASCQAGDVRRRPLLHARELR
jgi:hypothetical protein